VKHVFKGLLLAAAPIFLATTIQAANAAQPVARPRHHRHHGHKGHAATHHHANHHVTSQK
jgi:hypothetical protein